MEQFVATKCGYSVVTRPSEYNTFMTNRQIAATIEFEQGKQGTLLCFEDDQNAIWVRLVTPDSGLATTETFFSPESSFALIDGIVWAAALSGERDANSVFNFMTDPESFADPEKYMDDLLACANSLNTVMNVTVWHRNSARYNYALLFNDRIHFKVISDQVEGYLEDND